VSQEQEGFEENGVRVNDRRRIDPETFEIRQPAEPAGESSEGAVLEADLDATQNKVAELTADLQRVHAEYANYRKRVDRDRELAGQLAVSAVLAGLLPILDDIDRAREHGELDGAFRTVGEALQSTVTKIGLEQFGAAGEAFDPTLHEALTTEARDEVSEPTVVTVYQPGYRFAGRILRPARVAVAGAD
jgi:molecular chaperone GrpE